MFRRTALWLTVPVLAATAACSASPGADGPEPASTRPPAEIVVESAPPAAAQDEDEATAQAKNVTDCWYEPRFESPEAFESWAEGEHIPFLRQAGEQDYIDEFREQYAPYRVGEGGSWHIRQCSNAPSDAAKEQRSALPLYVWVRSPGADQPSEGT